MAFPSASRKSDDPEFLKPFKPDDFAQDPKQVHIARDTNAGFLFRVDPQLGASVVILVQSAIKPDWDYAFHNALYLLASPPEVKSFEPNFAKGERLQFLLVTNPTKRFSKNSLEKNGQPVADGWIGKRVPVATEQLYEWLSRRSEKAGYYAEKDSVIVQPGYIYVNEKLEGNGYRLRSVRYSGQLTVIDPERFRETIIHGIGPGKAYGFGLISVARLNF